MSGEARIGDTIRVRWPAILWGPLTPKLSVVTLTPDVVRYAERKQRAPRATPKKHARRHPR